MDLPPYSFAQAFSAWHFDAVTAVFVALLAAFYGWRVWRASTLGVRWPWWRTVFFLVLGLGGIVVCTMSSLAVYQHSKPWAFVIQISLLMTVVPVALAVGDPIGLLKVSCVPEAQARVDRVLSGRVARVFTFPLVAAILGVVVQMVFYFGPVLKPALEHGWAMNVVYLVALSVGCLLAWPLLGDDLLPAWCTPPLRMLFAALDGLLDAIPGIALVSAGTLIAHGYFLQGRPFSEAHADQQTAGTLAVAVAEVVAVPLLVVLFFQWARSELRANSADRRSSVADSAGRIAGEAEPIDASEGEESAVERPWWETDPGFGRRTEEYRGRGPGS